MQRIIINADDFGISEEANKAITYCFRQKIITQTTIMVNMSYAEEALTLSKENDFFDRVGLHLNLIEGKPLTEEIKKTDLCDAQGCFNGKIMHDFRCRLYLTAKERKAVKEEIIAQIEKYLNMGFPLRHIDSHQHAHTNQWVMSMLIPIIGKSGFHSMRLARNIPWENINQIKRTYKSFINRKVLRYNLNHGAKFNVIKFGSMKDAEKEIAKPDSDGIIEVMAHPLFTGNRLSDLIEETSIAEWIEDKKQFLIL